MTRAPQTTEQELRERVAELERALVDRQATTPPSIAEQLDDARTMLSVLGNIEGLGTWVWYTDSERVEWSRGFYEMLGLDPEVEPSIELFMATVHPEDVALMKAGIAEIAQTQHATPSTFRVVRPDGAIRHLYSQSYSSPGPAGRRLTGILLDVSERHELETQLRQAQKMEAVGALAGGVAHDVNNYLTVILGNTELVGLDLPPDDPSHELLGEIMEASERCRLLIQRLLAFSRRQVFAPRVLDLNELINDLLTLVGRLVGDNIEVVLRLSPSVGNIRADRTQIEQVLVNLAVNARDAMAGGGRLTLSSDRLVLDEEYCETHTMFSPGVYVRLTVSDSGEGIAQELQERIFDPFFTTKAEGKGTGLGLSTASGIVEQSGGVLTLYSEPGHGATFKIYLPAVLDRATPDPHAVARRPTQRGSGTVLLVEDDEQVRRLTTSQLERGGYGVLVARDGDQAVALADSHDGPIDLMLSDMMMPGKSGFEVAATIRARRPDMIVGYMSGYTPERLADQFEVDEAAVLQKPFTYGALLDWVAQLLDRRPA